MKKYRTRDGREVVIFTTESPDTDYPMAGAVKSKRNEWGNTTWTREGAYLKAEKEESPHDLIEVHPCDGLRSGDLVLVWNTPGTQRRFAMSFIGINKAGGVVTERKSDGVAETWEFGEPAE